MTRFLVSAFILALFFLAGRFLSLGDASASPGGRGAVSGGNGDINGDGRRDISDPIALLNWLFSNGSPPVACAGEGGGLTPEQEEILSHLQIVEIDDGHGRPLKTIRFTGVNVQVVNGLGATNGSPNDDGSVDPLVTRTNGLGNLIVGYQEGRPAGNDRTGSHNLVVGLGQSYSSFGGLIAGGLNTVSGPYGSVTAGTGNTASGVLASVTGGVSNAASGPGSLVAGGNQGDAQGMLSVVTGGQFNRAGGTFSVVVGGSDNAAGDPEGGGAGAGEEGGRFDLPLGPSICWPPCPPPPMPGDFGLVLGGSGNMGLGNNSVSVGGTKTVVRCDYCWAPGAGASKFQDNGDGTVTDSSTGLMWEKEPRVLRYDEAYAHCQQLKLGGYLDWRIPRAHELRTIVDYGRATNTDPAFGEMAGDYWTDSTPGHMLDPQVLTVMRIGNSDSVEQSWIRPVDSGGRVLRCVRSNYPGPLPTVDNCAVLDPRSLTLRAGQEFSANVMVNEPGITDQTLNAVDSYPGLVGQIGYGPRGSSPGANPGAWTWIAVSPWPFQDVPDNDEYFSQFSIPTPGSYDMAVRFSLNNGTSWAYGDLAPGGSADGYDPATAARVTVVPQ